MAYTVLARRYRSATFDDVIGQQHVSQTLKRAIESGRIAHAYLFCGTRGTGKTSMARILAKALNCLSFDAPTTTPCNTCDSCLAIARGDDIDVIEIDAASNTGVDNVREIIENSQYRPARSRFKVYIIDEVHMLSKSAFNALLKTLEEPPSHVKFILATTEPEKVLPTILSRCQRYDFRNIPAKEIAAHLKQICRSEKISADEDALALVAKAGNGSMRDALSLLDRLLSIGEKKLTTETIEQMLGLPRAQIVMDLVSAIGCGDVKGTLIQADAMIMSGLSNESLIGALVDHLRNLLIARTCGPSSELIDLPGIGPGELAEQAHRFDPVSLTQDISILEELRRNLRQSQIGRAALDATLARLAMSEQFTAIADLLAGGGGAAAARLDASQKKKPESLSAPPASAPVAQAQQSPRGFFPQTQLAPEPAPQALSARSDAMTEARFDAPDEEDDLPRPGKVWAGPSFREVLRDSAKSSPPSTAADAPNAALGEVAEIWPKVIENFRAKFKGMASILELATSVAVDDGIAVIQLPPNQETFIERLRASDKREALANVLTELRGRPTGVRFEVSAEPALPPPAAAPHLRRVERTASDDSAAPARAAAPMSQRPSQEMLEKLKDDPAIQAVLREFGGRIEDVVSYEDNA